MTENVAWRTYIKTRTGIYRTMAVNLAILAAQKSSSCETTLLLQDFPPKIKRPHSPPYDRSLLPNPPNLSLKSPSVCCIPLFLPS